MLAMMLNVVFVLVCGPNSLNASVANSIARFSTWNTVVDFRREAFEY